MADLGFTFNKEPIVKGLDAINKRMDSMKMGAKNMAQSVSKGLQSFAVKAVAVVGALKGVKQIFKEIPEIGQTFNIVKDVFLKNFAFPLRQEIIPLLQRVLDWTRDNRARFVKWGQAVVGVFKTLIMIGKQFGEIVLGAFDKINKAVLKGIGIEKWEDALNIITFKLAAVAIWASKALQPIIDNVVSLIELLLPKVLDLIKSILDGFLPAVEGIGKPIQGIFDNVVGILDNWTNLNTEGNSLMTVVKTLAEFFGNILTTVAELTESFTGGFKDATKEIMTPIQEIANAFKEIFDSIFGGEEKLNGWKAAAEKIGEIFGTGLVNTFQLIADAATLIALGVETFVGLLEDFANSKSMQDIKNMFDGAKESLGLGGFKMPKILGEEGLIHQGIQSIINRKETNIEDAIIRPNGDIIRTNPKDTIVALKSPSEAVMPRLVGNTGTSYTHTFADGAIQVNFGDIGITGGVTVDEFVERVRNDFPAMFRQIVFEEMARAGA